MLLLLDCITEIIMLLFVYFQDTPQDQDEEEPDASSSTDSESEDEFGYTWSKAD